MKLKLHDDIYDYNVTITAEIISPFGDKVGDTKKVLSTLENILWDAWKYRKDNKFDAMAEEAAELATSLHEELTKKGYYKEVKNNETK